MKDELKGLEKAIKKADNSVAGIIRIARELKNAWEPDDDIVLTIRAQAQCLAHETYSKYIDGPKYGVADFALVRIVKELNKVCDFCDNNRFDYAGAVDALEHVRNEFAIVLFWLSADLSAQK